MRAGQEISADVKVPAYLPDIAVVRSDLLDYAVEVEWADAHIGRALEALEAAGELDNTLVIVTSDHGMPFPRVKGQIYEDGFHLPLAMRWGKGIKPGRVVEDFINVRDFAPTFLELAGLEAAPADDRPEPGRRCCVGEIGLGRCIRDVMLVGKERHDIGRPNDWGYPVRAYPHAGVPLRPQLRSRPLAGGKSRDRLRQLRPRADEGGAQGRSAAISTSCPSASGRPMLSIALSDDPECVRNLADDPFFQPVMSKLREQMLKPCARSRTRGRWAMARSSTPTYLAGGARATRRG